MAAIGVPREAGARKGTKRPGRRGSSGLSRGGLQPPLQVFRLAFPNGCFFVSFARRLAPVPLSDPGRQPADDDADEQGQGKEDGERRLDRRRELLIYEGVPDERRVVAVRNPIGDQNDAEEKKKNDSEEASHGCLGKKPVAKN